MKTATDAGTQPQTQIRDDHATIFKLVASIEANLGARMKPEEWVTSVTHQLMALGELLVPHFRLERDAELYDHGHSHAPHLAEEFKRLERQHQEFLNEIGAVLALARSAMDPDPELVQRLSARVTALFAAMREHESAENELLIRYVGEDDGVGD